MTLLWSRLRGSSDAFSLRIRPAILVDGARSRVVMTWDTGPGTSLLSFVNFAVYDRAPYTPFGVPVFCRRVEAA